MKTETEPINLDIFGNCRNGTLKVFLLHSCQYPTGEQGMSEDERFPEVCISGKNLRSLNLEIFRLVVGQQPEVEGYGIKDWGENEHQILSEFPMISKMKWTSLGLWEDALYTPEEAKLLLEECLKIKANTSDASADLAARKMIYSCNEAVQRWALPVFVRRLKYLLTLFCHTSFIVFTTHNVIC